MTDTKTVHVVRNFEVGAADWVLDEKDLPSYDEYDERFTLTVPAETPHEELTDQMDVLLGECDLPDGWVLTPVGITH